MTSNDIVYDMDLVSQNAPLVLNITNYAAMNFTASALLALGAHPIMANAKEEIVDVTKTARSLVLNIGTPSKEWTEAMLCAGKVAYEQHIPIIFDPVGVETTPFRHEIAQQIIKECHPSIIRGNVSEIKALCTNEQPEILSLDPEEEQEANLAQAQKLASDTGAIVIMSGPTDYITNGSDVISMGYGSPIMKRVNIMGSTATAICAAFAAVEQDMFNAATAAMAIIGIAGQATEKDADGPGTFMVHFVDTLYKMSTHEFEFDVRFNEED